MSNLLRARVREKAERESRIYRENAERRVQEARRVCQRGCDLKRDENQRRYSPVHSLDREIAGKTPGRGERGDDAAQEGRVKAGREYGRDVSGDSLSPVYREWRTLWYLGGRIQTNLEEIRKQEETLQKLNAKTWAWSLCRTGTGNSLSFRTGNQRR